MAEPLLTSQPPLDDPFGGATAELRFVGRAIVSQPEAPRKPTSAFALNVHRAIGVCDEELSVAGTQL